MVANIRATFWLRNFILLFCFNVRAQQGLITGYCDWKLRQRLTMP
jgi:hypothetical protein